MLIKIVGHPALAEFVVPVFGVETNDLFAIAGRSKIESDKVADFGRAISVDERAALAELNLTSVVEIGFGDVEHRKFDRERVVPGHFDERTDRARGFELDRTGLLPVGNFDFWRGDEVDVVLTYSLGEVLGHPVTKRLLTSRTDADLSFEHLPRSFARTETREADLFGDQLERLVDLGVELSFFDFDVQLDLVALEGFYRTLHRRPSVPVTIIGSTRGETAGDRCHQRSVGAGSGVFGGELGEPFSRAANRLDVAVIEIADFGAVLEQHAIALPIEPVSKNDLALGTNGNAVNFGGRADLVVHLEKNLAVMRRGELMRLPELHRFLFCRMTTHLTQVFSSQVRSDELRLAVKVAQLGGHR